MKRAVIYTRVSLDTTKEGSSVARQLAACRALAEARGWTVEHELSDNSISAYSGKQRPAWGDVLKLVESGQVDVIIAWHIDRMLRSMLELEHLILLAEERGIGVATATGDIDLTTDVGRMVARILAAVARAEVERKAARQRLANTQKAERGGVHAGGPRPFGFEPDKVTLNEAEVAVIRETAQALLDGAVLATEAKRWGRTPAAVRRALLAPRMVGKREHLGQVHDAVWPAIITEEQQLSLRLLLNDNSRRNGGHTAGRSSTTLLSGIMLCSTCGEPVRAGGTGTYLSYVCRAGHAAIKRDMADDYVASAVVAALLQPNVLSELSARSDRGALTVRVAELRSRLNTLSESFVAGIITAEQLTVGSQSARAKLDEAERELATAVAGSALDGLSVGRREVIEQWEGLALHRKRGLIETLVRVELHPSGQNARRSVEERIAVNGYTPA